MSGNRSAEVCEQRESTGARAYDRADTVRFTPRATVGRRGASGWSRVDAQKFLAFITSKQGQEIIAHSISFEYPIASGVTTAQPETPFNQLQPNPITIPELGDGSTAIALLQRAGLL